MFVWGAREPPPHWHNLNTAPQLAASGPGATVRGRFDSAEQLLLLNTSTSSTQGQEAGAAALPVCSGTTACRVRRRDRMSPGGICLPRIARASRGRLEAPE